jgi:MFS family permease
MPVSPYRWVVLGVYMLITALSQIMWMTFAPIARDAAAVYTGGNVDYIDYLAVLAMFSWIPFVIPASWFIDTYGIKKGAGIGVVLTGMCGFLRIFAPDYTWLFVCMAGCAIAQPFILNAFSKLAGNWFPEKEEALATGMLTMAMFIGFATVMFATDLLMAHYRTAGSVKQGIDAILKIYGIAAFAAMILFFIFFRDKPEFPPNPIAAEKKVTMTIGLKALFKNKDYIILMACFFIGLGAFNGILTAIDTIFKDRTLDVDSALAPGIVGGLMVVGGLIGAVVISALSDKFHKRKIFLIISLATAIPLTILINLLSSIVLLGICGFVFGFFLVPALPVGLTFAVEKTHPVPEATSNGMLMLCGQVSGIPIVLFFNMTVLTVLFCIGTVLLLFLKEDKISI